jgi:type II secretory pathway pseudopilin PulG
MSIQHQKGISIVEIIIVIAITAMLIIVVLPTLSSFRNQQALRNTTEDVLSLLNEARSDTQGSLNGTNYSVYIQSTQATYFAGSTYTNGLSTNKVVTYDSRATVPASGGINLNGGGSIVTFNRLSGDTSTYGTIIIQLVSDATQQKTITISKTGFASSN